MRVYLLDAFCTIPYYMGSLCAALQRAGVDAILGTTSYYQERRHFADRGLRPDPGCVDFVAHLPKLSPKLRRPLKLVEGLANLAALSFRFAARPPDIIHVQFLPLLMRGSSLELRLLRLYRKRGSRIVYTVHDRLPHDTGREHWERYRRVYHSVDALICHSHVSKDEIAREFGVAPDRIRVIPHGPLFLPTAPPDPRQARARLGLPMTACVVVCQGIIKPYKGIPFLLEAWDSLARGRDDVLLVIVGTGEEAQLQAIRSRVAKMSRPEAVRCDFRFVPENELSDYLDAADILVYPYREVTTSGALLTGLARRKPIVATNLPPFRELLGQEDSAVLVEYGDVERLASALRTLAGDPDMRERLARGAGRLLQGELSWDAIADKTRKWYEAVLEERF